MKEHLHSSIVASQLDPKTAVQSVTAALDNIFKLKGVCVGQAGGLQYIVCLSGQSLPEDA